MRQRKLSWSGSPFGWRGPGGAGQACEPMRYRVLLAMGVVLAGGCVPALLPLGTGQAGSAGGSAGQSAPVAEAVAGAQVRLEVVNAAGVEAWARVRMELGGEEVHLAERRVRPGGSAVIVGPDRADAVTVEAVLGANRDIRLPTRVFRYGRDFTRDTTLRVMLTLPEPNVAPPVEPNVPGEPNRPAPPAGPNVPVEPNRPAPLEFGIVRLTPGRVFTRGSVIRLKLHVAHAPAAARVDVLAVPLDWTDGNDGAGGAPATVVIAGGLPPADGEIRWLTLNAQALVHYQIVAELRAQGQLLARETLSRSVGFGPDPRVRVRPAGSATAAPAVSSVPASPGDVP